MNVVHLQRVINIHMKAIDIIKTRHELYEAKLPGPLGFGQAAYDVAVAGLKAIYRLGTKGTKYSDEAKAFVDTYAKKYADEMSKRKMLGHRDDIPFAEWWQKELATEKPTIPKLGRDGSPITGRDGNPIMEPNPRYADSVANQPFANNPGVVKQLGKEAEKQAVKVHAKNLKAISTARTAKTIEEIKEKYKVLQASLVGFGIADTALSGVWPAYQHWSQTNGNIQGFQELGTTQPDYIAQIKAAGFDPANITAEAQEWINTKLKPSSPSDMAAWVDKESTINDQRVKTELYSIGYGIAATVVTGATFIKILKICKLNSLALIVSELLTAGGIALFGEFVNEVKEQGVSRELGELISSQLQGIVTTTTDNATGKEISSKATHSISGMNSASNSWDIALRSLAHSLDRICRGVLESSKYAQALRKNVGNTIAGNDTAPTAPTPVPTPIPATPASGAADDKKSTTPADQSSPKTASKVDANGIKQGEVGYTTDSGWKIEGIYPNGVLWGNPNKGNGVTNDKLLPPGEEPK